MLHVVTWLWRPPKDYHSQFTPRHVNILQRMVKRHYPHPHQFHVITDMTRGFGKDVNVIPLWEDFSTTESIYGAGSPSCYRRLRAFSAEMKTLIGERFVSLDLDAVITGDMSPVWNRKEDFVIWGEDGRRTPFNGSMWMMNSGARAEVWDRFVKDPGFAMSRALQAGYYGTDQAWISYLLGERNEKRWTWKDGVYSFREHLKHTEYQLPEAARIVFFNGKYFPDTLSETIPWIDKHYR
jgi:hypothetical protein